MSIFETLMQLPLFQGISRDQLSALVGHYKFDFKKFTGGNKIVAAGEPCNSLIFILSGRTLTRLKIANLFTLSFTRHSNTVIYPEYLLGLSTVYPADVFADENVSVLEIAKADILKILTENPVFQFNFLNILSHKAQQSARMLPFLTAESFAPRFKELISIAAGNNFVSLNLSSDKNSMADSLGINDSTYLQAMNHLKSAGIITSFDMRNIVVKP